MLKMGKKNKDQDNIISSNICPNKDVTKKSTSIGVYQGKFYFGFWIPWEETYENGETKIVQKITLINSEHEIFKIESREYWKFFSKGEENRISIPIITSWTRSDVSGSVDGPKLFSLIRDVYIDNFDLQEINNYDYMALFDISTYFIPIFETAPQIHIQGNKNSGKTKLMQCSSLMSFNGRVMSSFTIATVFRYVDESSPTLYIDEADKLLKSDRDGIEELVAMFNSGYKRGTKVPRCNKLNQIEWFDVFSPKVYGSINNVPSDFSTRCHKIIMVRAKPGDIRAERGINEKDPIFKDLRNNLYIFALQNWEDVRILYESLENKTNLKFREWEIWKPILTIAKYLSEDLYKSVVEFAEKSSKRSKEEDNFDGNWDIVLVRCLSFIVDYPKYYRLSEIKKAMEELFEDPNQPKPTSKWIGSALRKQGITDFRQVCGMTEVFLTQKSILEIANRLDLELDKSCSIMKNSEGGVK